MSSLTLSAEPLAQSEETTDSELSVYLTDGRVLSAPLVWFPRLLSANSADRAQYELTGNGVGIYWPIVDEDVSVTGLLAGRPSIEFRA